MTCPTDGRDGKPPHIRVPGCAFLCVPALVLVLLVVLVYGRKSLPLLNDGASPKTFWRKDYDTVVKYHIRDYRVPWSVQLRAAIAFARKHGERLYLEDTPPEVFARNRGNVKTVELSESERSALQRVSDFLAEYCSFIPQAGDATGTIRVFPDAEIGAEAKRLLDDVLTEHPLLFYAHYLLAVWHRERGNDLAATHFDKAFEVADCVVICPVMTLAERSGEVLPVTETCFPFGISTQHRTRQGNDFTLWYPAATTDQHGLICLPVYREMTADLALEAVDADCSRRTVETFGLRDIASSHRFGLYVPVVLSGEQLSQLTCPPGFEEELRYVKRRVFANLSLDDTATLRDLGVTLELPARLQAAGGGVLMPTLRYANEFGELFFRSTTRTELARQLRQYRDEHFDQCPPLLLADGDNFIVSRHDGRTYLCRFLAGSKTDQTGLLDVWEIGWIKH
ncbi:MAG: hypothetical protein FWD31_02615 [Planctomycetaceae bacterium]|nr:hypothetical protein [Planctomycetaceae bacterium]